MENNLVCTILNCFCKKQGFTASEITVANDESVVVFDGQFMMLFGDVLLDVELDIKKGIAVNYMQGFDLDLEDAKISKDLSYRSYLENKKLI